MKSSRFKKKYRDSASRGHCVIGDILRDPKSGFSLYKIYQEYPVNRINKSYQYSSHHFDWVILDLMIVIEVNGAQHYQVTTFGSQSVEKAADSLAATKLRDNCKRQAAVDAGFTYIEIPWYDINKVTASYLWDRIEEYYNPGQGGTDEEKEVLSKGHQVEDASTSYQEVEEEAQEKH